MRTLATACLLLSLASVVPRTSHAQAVRAVVLAKQTLDGTLISGSGLESAASVALSRAGVRLVDLEAALRSQRFALSDAIQSGHVPNELSVLNADAWVSLQLHCAVSAEKVLGTGIRAEQCVLDSKVIATSSGDVIFSHSDTFTGHGLSAPMAVQSVIGKQLPMAIELSAAKWLPHFIQPDAWEVDLTVTQLSDRETARALSALLSHLPGVTGARMGVFDRGLARYTLAGSGRAELDTLADEIESEPLLALTVNYEAPRVMHAEFQVAKAYRRSVMVMAVAPDAARLRAVVPELVRASVLNLPYLEMAHTQPLVATPAEARAFEARLRIKANELKVPLVLCGSLNEGPTGVSASLRLLESGSGRTVVATTAEAAVGAQAFDAAVRALDQQFRAALAHADVRERLGLQLQGGSLSRQTRLVIHAFKVPTWDDSRAERQGKLLVRNTSDTPVRNGELRLSAGTREFEPLPISAVAPGELRELIVPLGQVAVMEQDSLLLTASVTYPAGATYERVSAIAPLVRSQPHVEAPGDTASEGPLDPSYSALVRDGVLRHNAGDWQNARKAFLRAHQVFPNARTLRALGMVEFDLGNRDQAFDYLTQALNHAVRPLSDPQRTDVRHLLVRLRPIRGGRGVETIRL